MEFGKTLASPPLRIYLAGQVRIESGATLVEERQFPGRQGRLLFAYLVCERRRPVSRDALGEALWPGAQPSAWEVALSALVSKLRRLLQSLGLPVGSATISSHGGRYRLHLPIDTWVDVEAAVYALDEAEGLLRAHAAAGNRAGALRVYERCRMLLAAEVGAEPSPALQRLYQHLLC